jgi:hypothetical protein
MGVRGGSTHLAPDVLNGGVEVEPAADKVNDLQSEGGARLEHVALAVAATNLGGAATDLGSAMNRWGWQGRCRGDGRRGQRLAVGGRGVAGLSASAGGDGVQAAAALGGARNRCGRWRRRTRIAVAAVR